MLHKKHQTQMIRKSPTGTVKANKHNSNESKKCRFESPSARSKQLAGKERSPKAQTKEGEPHKPQWSGLLAAARELRARTNDRVTSRSARRRRRRRGRRAPRACGRCGRDRARARARTSASASASASASCCSGGATTSRRGYRGRDSASASASSFKKRTH